MASPLRKFDLHPVGPVVQLFSNPAAGTHSLARIQRLTAALEAGGAKVLHSECVGTPVIADAADHVCIAGGDGTVRHVATVAARRRRRPVTFSIFPAGTINLLAREADYPADPDAFARMILEGRPVRSHFPVMLGDGYFFACAGVGPDSYAVAGVSPALKRQTGRFAYLAAFVELLWHWPRHEIRLRAEGREIVCEAFYVAKGRYYAGPWSLSRDARVDDPLLHVVALPKARRRDYLRFVLGLVRGKDAARQKGVEVFTCRALAAEGNRPLPLQADGDIVASLPVSMVVADSPLAFC